MCGSEVPLSFIHTGRSMADQPLKSALKKQKVEYEVVTDPVTGAITRRPKATVITAATAAPQINIVVSGSTNSIDSAPNLASDIDASSIISQPIAKNDVIESTNSNDQTNIPYSNDESQPGSQFESKSTFNSA